MKPTPPPHPEYLSKCSLKNSLSHSVRDWYRYTYRGGRGRETYRRGWGTILSSNILIFLYIPVTLFLFSFQLGFLSYLPLNLPSLILFVSFYSWLSGLAKLRDRFSDPYMQDVFSGLFPRDNARDTRFAINFFTSIGLGGLTDGLRGNWKVHRDLLWLIDRCDRGGPKWFNLWHWCLPILKLWWQL